MGQATGVRRWRAVAMIGALTGAGLVTLGVDTTPARADTGSRVVALQARANGKVVGVSATGGVAANAGVVTEAEKFDMVSLGSSFYSFRSHLTGKFLTAHQNAFLSASDPSVGQAQSFHVDGASGGVTMYSGESGDNVRVLTNGTLADDGVRAPLLDSPIFVIIPLSGVVSIKSAFNGKQVTVTSDGTKMLYATASGVSVSEKFSMIDQPNGFVTFLSLGTSQFVSADLNEGANLRADRIAIGDWEKFRVIVNSDFTLSLRAVLANNQVVSTEYNNAPSGRLVANRADVGGAWEKFTFSLTS